MELLRVPGIGPVAAGAYRRAACGHQVSGARRSRPARRGRQSCGWLPHPERPAAADRPMDGAARLLGPRGRGRHPPCGLQRESRHLPLSSGRGALAPPPIFPRMHVVVVGAGLAGLSAASALLGRRLRRDRARGARSDRRPGLAERGDCRRAGGARSGMALRRRRAPRSLRGCGRAAGSFRGSPLAASGRPLGEPGQSRRAEREAGRAHSAAARARPQPGRCPRASAARTCRTTIAAGCSATSRGSTPPTRQRLSARWLGEVEAKQPAEDSDLRSLDGTAPILRALATGPVKEAIRLGTEVVGLGWRPGRVELRVRDGGEPIDRRRRGGDRAASDSPARSP